MADFPRPPSDITPGEFFESWLPEQYQRVRQSAGADTTPPDGTLVVELDGEGGGTWTLTMKGGELSVATGAVDGAELHVRQQVSHWRAVIGAGSEDLIPASFSPLQMLTAGAAAGDALADVTGTLTFQVPGFGDDTWSVAVTFRAADAPAATISVDAATLEAMRAGTLPPPQAFFAGKIQITGDQAFAMSLGMALMAKMQP